MTTRRLAGSFVCAFGMAATLGASAGVPHGTAECERALSQPPDADDTDGCFYGL
jgi:hypothetical protein